MVEKKDFFTLLSIDFLFIGIYALYIILPEKYSLGYYPIGIISIILLAVCLRTLFLYIKNNVLHKKVTLKSILLLFLYFISIVIIAISIYVWFAFSPLNSGIFGIK